MYTSLGFAWWAFCSPSSNRLPLSVSWDQWQEQPSLGELLPPKHCLLNLRNGDNIPGCSGPCESPAMHLDLGGIEEEVGMVDAGWGCGDGSQEPGLGLGFGGW